MWDFLKPENNVWYCWHLNGAAVYLKKDAGIWKTAFKAIPFHERNNNLEGPLVEEPPDSLPVSAATISAPDTDEQVMLHPYLSDLPYIIKLREKLSLGSEQEIQFTAELPPILKFELAPEAVIAEITPFTLPRTFFGPDTMDGVLGYSLPADLEKKTKPSALIYCDILIKNRTKNTLTLECLALNTEALNIYFYENKLVTDILEIDFSEETNYKTSVSQRRGEGYRLINTGLKCGLGENIARQSIDIIKNITQI